MTRTRRLLFIPVCVMFPLLVAACSNPERVKRDHLQRGDAYVKDKKYAEAIIEYRNVVQADPNSGDARRKLAEAYLAAGDIPNGYREYVRAADLLPNDVEVQLTAGGMRLLAKQFDDARSTAEKILAKDPSNVRAMVLRGNALAGVKNVPDAVSDIEEAIKLDPGRGALYSNLGSLELQRQHLADAEAAFKKATAVAPKSAPAFSALGSFYFSANRMPESEQAFKKAVELDPQDVVAHRALAAFYLATGRRAEAEAPLRALAETNPSVEARLTLADYYLLGGKNDKGIQILEAVEKEKSGRVPAATRLAALKYAGGRRAEAHQSVDALLAAEPDNAQALLLKARFLYLEHRSDEALDRARAAVKANPRSTQGYFLIGQIERDKQHTPEAVQAFTEVLRINPRAAAAQLELSHLQLATGNPGAAVQSAEQAVRNAPAAIQTRLALARSLLAHGDAARADVELKPLQRSHPDDPAVMAISGDLYLARKQYAEARRAYTSAYTKDRSSLDALAGLIALDLLAGKPADAHAKMDAHLAKAPVNSAALILAARTYAATRDMPRTEAVLRKAIDIDPSNLQAYGMLGQFYYAQGRIADGRTEFEKVVKRDPKSIPANTMLGIILEKQGHRDEARAKYESVLAIDSHAPVAANNLAWMYAESGEQLDVALQLARTASTGLPDQPEVADTLGWIYHKKGLPKLAIPILRQVVEKNPQDPQYRYHLGVVLASLGDSDAAKEQLQKALALKPDFAGADDARRVLATLQ